MFLPQVDELVLIENGKIIDSGSFDALMKSNGPFSGYFGTFLNINEDMKIQRNSLFYCVVFNLKRFNKIQSI